jgi:hypothetical protein
MTLLAKRKVLTDKGRQKAGHTIGEIPESVWPMVQTMLDEHYPVKPIEYRRVDLCRCCMGLSPARTPAANGPYCRRC